MDQQPLHIQLLGGFLLSAESGPLALPHSPRLQALLAFLILHRDTPQPRRHIAFCLWPDSSEGQAQTNLRQILHQLRRILPAADTALCLDGRSLQLRDGGPLACDVVAFERALARARCAQAAGDLPGERAQLEEAAACYRGDLLPSCYDDWLLAERERLRQDFIAALDRQAALCEEQREYPAAIRAVQRLLQVEHLSETAHLRLIRLLALSGDRAAGLHAYHTCAALLRRELDAEPGPALRQAYHRLAEDGGEQAVGPPAGATTALVGRDGPWRSLLDAWHAVGGGLPRLLLLSGEAGIGKTRLAEEFLQWVGRQGFRHARAQCYPGEGDLAYAPVRTWLRGWLGAEVTPSTLSPIWLAQLARLAPELVGPPPDAPAAGAAPEPWQRQQLFEALRQALLAAAPAALFLDDLQWCDQASLEWLHYLLRSPSPSRLLVIAALRPEEPQPTGQPGELLADLRARDLAAEVLLGPLDPDETAALAAQVAGRPLATEESGAVYRETEGNPLCIIEIVRALAEGQRERAAGAPAYAALPTRIQAVFARRLQQLSPLAREIVEAAAVIGRPFDAPLLSLVCPNLDEEALVRGLDELWQRRVIGEEAGGAYAFSHCKLREVAARELSAARRRLLNRRVAAALERRCAAGDEAAHALIAGHYEQAGCHAQAIGAYRRAAAGALAVYAHADAARSYRRALALLAAAREGADTADLPAALAGEHLLSDEPLDPQQLPEGPETRPLAPDEAARAGRRRT